jgi:nucleotide-binding universal stress UspA family protein
MTMIPKSILAATDFSKTADRAADLARDLAQTFGAHLHILHAAILLEDHHLESHRKSQLDELLRSGDAARRKELEATYESAHGIDITPHLIRGMAPAEVIVETAGSLDCGLIVMGTHGRKGLSHLILGSVAGRVVRTSSRPVLTVRADAEVDADGLRSILVPHDFSEASNAALQQAAAWARVLGASITLLHVVEPVVYPEFYAVDVMSDATVERMIDRSREALDKSAAKLDGLEVETLVRRGHAAETIVDTAVPNRFDLVVMATRGLSGLEHVVLGSVAESVLRRCALPLLSIPIRSSDA